MSGLNPPFAGAADAGVMARIIVLLLVAFGSCSTAATAAYDAPRHEERRLALAIGLATSVNLDGDLDGVSLALVSSVSPRWAWVVGSDRYGRLMYRGHRWRVVDRFAPNEPNGRLCLEIPTAVARDLFALSCPPRRRLHSRSALPAAQVKLQKAYAASHGGVAPPPGPACISLLNPRWAVLRGGARGWYAHAYDGAWHQAVAPGYEWQIPRFIYASLEAGSC
jgi:hypothetical protein